VSLCVFRAPFNTSGAIVKDLFCAPQTTPTLHVLSCAERLRGQSLELLRGGLPFAGLSPHSSLGILYVCVLVVLTALSTAPSAQAFESIILILYRWEHMAAEVLEEYVVCV
jgi:hypothetical protein